MERNHPSAQGAAKNGCDENAEQHCSAPQGKALRGVAQGADELRAKVERNHPSAQGAAKLGCDWNKERQGHVVFGGAKHGSVRSSKGAKAHRINV